MIHINVCHEGGLSELVSVAKQSYFQHYTHLWEDNGVHYVNENFNENTIRQQLADTNSIFFLVYDNSQLAGFLKLNIDKALETMDAKECLEVEKIYLLKAAAGKGIGKQLLEFVKTFARSKNKKIIWLKAMESSQAIHFYKRQGFMEQSTIWLDFALLKDKHRKMYVLKCLV